ncbi:MAG TPA: SDR family oxidoreductase [Planctomycetota bacterium]|nr:SDR family oxidoreductase [Planctomycetota bacterium]HRR81297.1 SDR family oxidoreductase [Planctomycetota bacterium]HRT95191.1 SDR family oxidoreductase [Planctomycetota bacterium]
MTRDELGRLFALEGKVAVVTGAGGVLYSGISKALGALGVRLAILDIREDAAQAVAADVNKAGGDAIGVPCDVLKRESIEAARDAVVRHFGHVDILINGAGGNHPKATATDQLAFFDIPPEATRWVFELNCLGSILPSQVFGKHMAERKEGVILNTSSMCAFTPLTRVIAYSAAKAAVSNFTQWLATHMARNYSPAIRVNAIAPGFFLGDQNRYLLVDEKTGDLTPRGRTIIEHTPMGRFGVPDDLIGTVVWLLSPAAAFVTGIVVPIDGGFSAFSGV